jgi:hypothetical protein
MKRRFQYVLLFSVPAFLAGIIASVAALGVVAGGLWIFVFGDNEWPAMGNHVLVAVLVVVFIASFLSLLAHAYNVGKKQEEYEVFNANHLFLAFGTTALLVMVAVIHQWSVGNFGEKSGSEMCADYCRGKGYAASGTPPKNSGVDTCSCFATQDKEGITVPMSEVRSQE